MQNNLISRIKGKLRAASLYADPVLYVQDFLGFVRGETLLYELKNGLKYEVRAGTCDRGIIDEIFAYACYTPAGFTIQEGDTVIDIGAQIGIFSTYAARSSKTGTVYSLEPFPENFALLRRNVELNALTNIQTSPVALADKEGTTDLFVSHNSGGHSLHGSETQPKITIRTMTLAGFLAEKGITKVDYLKIDCEGGEYDILFTADDDVFSKISKIGMECHGLDETRSINTMATFLKGKGFEVELAQGLFPMLWAKKPHGSSNRGT